MNTRSIIGILVGLAIGVNAFAGATVTVPGDYSTIGAALAAVDPDGTVQITAANDYDLLGTPLVIAKNVTIEGTVSGVVVVDSTPPAGEQAMVTIDGSAAGREVTLDNIKMEPSPTADGYHGLSIVVGDDPSTVTLTDMTISLANDAFNLSGKAMANVQSGGGRLTFLAANCTFGGDGDDVLEWDSFVEASIGFDRCDVSDSSTGTPNIDGQRSLQAESCVDCVFTCNDCTFTDYGASDPKYCGFEMEGCDGAAFNFNGCTMTANYTAPVAAFIKNDCLDNTVTFTDCTLNGSATYPAVYQKDLANLMNNNWVFDRCTINAPAGVVSSVLTQTSSTDPSSFVFKNCLVKGGAGTLIDVAKADVIAYHCTFVGTTPAAGHTAIASTDNSGLEVAAKNNIFGDALGTPISLGAATAAIDTNMFAYAGATAGTVGANPIYADPQFISTGNYSLQPSSPAINRGLSGVDVGGVDIDGASRPAPAGSQPDLGAYEVGDVGTTAATIWTSYE